MSAKRLTIFKGKLVYRIPISTSPFIKIINQRNNETFRFTQQQRCTDSVAISPEGLSFKSRKGQTIFGGIFKCGIHVLLILKKHTDCEQRTNKKVSPVSKLRLAFKFPFTYHKAWCKKNNNLRNTSA